MEALTNHSSVSDVPQRNSDKSDSVAFNIIFVTIFMLFLAIAVLASFLRMPWRSWFPGAEQSSSLIGGIKAAVYTLMSHLT
ncbi:MAG: hypothetical protein CBD16_01705 [Betaproteobacteria bacterium TMED156]|nr:MAG: hypothetical protein CBD16_01705 [Betaproteobacteria bacterium TMED156]